MRFFTLCPVALAGLLLLPLPAAGQPARAAQATTFLLVDKDDDGSPRARRLFKPLADLVARELRKKGYRPVAKGDGADIVVDLQYSVNTNVSSYGTTPDINAAGNRFEENNVALNVQVFDPLRDGMVFDRTAHRKTMGLPRLMLPAIIKEALQDFPAATD